MREWVVHAPVRLELPELLDGLVQVKRHISRLGGGVVAIADVDLAVAHLVVADHEDEVV